MRAMGIDVSLVHGLDVVILAADGKISSAPLNCKVEEISALLRDAKPDVVAIDSPPEWGTTGKSRPIEKQLRKLGVNIYSCPIDPGDHPFYAWMRAGFDVFDAVVAASYERYRGGPAKGHSCIEVFPHASGVVIRGTLPAVGTPKNVWRRKVLEDAGVQVAMLRSVHQLDAGLAALTGMRFLNGEFSVVGEAGGAVLVLPISHLPEVRYRRDTREMATPDPFKARWGDEMIRQAQLTESILVDQDVYDALKQRVGQSGGTPNAVLRQLLHLLGVIDHG